jgi:hypothetical protein
MKKKKLTKTQKVLNFLYPISVRTLYFALGFTIGAHVYSKVFDPETYWEESKRLAAETARAGCVQGGNKTFAECTEIANRIYQSLDEIVVKNEQ